MGFSSWFWCGGIRERWCGFARWLDGGRRWRGSAGKGKGWNGMMEDFRDDFDDRFKDSRGRSGIDPTSRQNRFPNTTIRGMEEG